MNRSVCNPVYHENPQVIGYGINNKETFNQATQFAKGAIIGSAFIKNLTEIGVESIEEFVNGICNDNFYY